MNCQCQGVVGRSELQQGTCRTLFEFRKSRSEALFSLYLGASPVPIWFCGGERVVKLFVTAFHRVQWCFDAVGYFFGTLRLGNVGGACESRGCPQGNTWPGWGLGKFLGGVGAQSWGKNFDLLGRAGGGGRGGSGLSFNLCVFGRWSAGEIETKHKDSNRE